MKPESCSGGHIPSFAGQPNHGAHTRAYAFIEVGVVFSVEDIVGDEKSYGGTSARAIESNDSVWGIYCFRKGFPLSTIFRFNFAIDVNARAGDIRVTFTTSQHRFKVRCRRRSCHCEYHAG